MAVLREWQNALRASARAEKISDLSRFFKTGKGGYGEGDRFIGLTVPDNRAVSGFFAGAPLPAVEKMLMSPFHEFRMSALLVLVDKYRKARRDPVARAEIVGFYLAHTAGVNNWDLVDLSCPKILGIQQFDHPETDLLTPLSDSGNLWEKRMAIVSTWYLIRQGEYGPTLRFAEKFLSHPHDLIHKATGWMLREVGKFDMPVLRGFLDRFAPVMPRTALRYALEKMPAAARAEYLRRPQD